MSDATKPDMAAFGASDAACYKWPDDTEQAKACRSAYCEGAADGAEAIMLLQAFYDAWNFGEIPSETSIEAARRILCLPDLRKKLPQNH